MDLGVGAGELAPVRKGDDHLEDVPRLGRPVRRILHEPGVALQEEWPSTRGVNVSSSTSRTAHIRSACKPAHRDRRPRQTFPAHRLDRIPPDFGDAAGHADRVGDSTPTGAPSLDVESRHKLLVAGEHVPTPRGLPSSARIPGARHLLRLREQEPAARPRRACYGRAAIVSISASDCRIAAAIHNPLAIAPADADPLWYFARRSGSSQGA